MAGSSARARTIELKPEGSPAVRVLFVEEAGRIFVLPSSDETGWFFDALVRGGVRTGLPDGQERDCATDLVYARNDLEAIVDRFRGKYGERTVRRYFGGARRALRIDPDCPPRRPTPDERLRAEFDSVAPSYDASVESHPMERYLKDRAARRIEARLATLDPLLEIGPGTGYHTLRLLAGGHRIVAVDLSSGMLDRLRERARAVGVDDRLETVRGRLRDLPELLHDRPSGSFGGVVSAFGAFNLEPDIARSRPALERLVVPEGRIVFTTLNRPGLAPLAWSLLLGRFGEGFRRTAEIVPVGGLRYPLELRLPSLAGWDRLFRPEFHRLGLEAVSPLAPPFDSPRLLAFLGPNGRRRARSLDARMAGLAAAPLLSEWLLLTYGRTESGQTRAT